jgi:hypothetical protein
MTAWQSLYILDSPQSETSSHIRHALTNAGFHFYNPFGLIPAKPYSVTCRLFIAPAAGRWTRVIGALSPEHARELSQVVSLIQCELRGDKLDIEGYSEGSSVPLNDWLRDNLPEVQFPRMDAPARPSLVRGNAPAFVPMGALPEDVRRMAQGINARHAAKMFERMSADLLKRSGGDPDAAKSLLTQQDMPDWQSAGGQQLEALAEAFGWGAAWREPDFSTLRDAYQAAQRRQRRPEAAPFPGDAEALAAVPNALDYIPVFAGKEQ